MTRKPKDPSKPIKIDGKEWWWCSPETGGKCTGVLRRHKPSQCKGLAAPVARAAGGKRAGNESDTDSSKKPKLKADETCIEPQVYKNGPYMEDNEEHDTDEELWDRGIHPIQLNKKNQQK